MPWKPCGTQHAVVFGCIEGVRDALSRQDSNASRVGRIPGTGHFRVSRRPISRAASTSRNGVRNTWERDSGPVNRIRCDQQIVDRHMVFK